MIRTGDYAFIDVSDGVTKTPIGNVVERLFRVLRNAQQTVVIQHLELIKRITTDRFVLAPRLLGLLPIPSESASAMDILNKILEGTPWLFYRILDHFLKNDGQLEFLSNCGPHREAKWDPCNNVLEEAISRYIADMRREMPDWYK